MSSARKNQAIFLLVVEILFIATSAFWQEVVEVVDLQWMKLLYLVFLCGGGYMMANSKKWLLCYVLLSLGGGISGWFSGQMFAFMILQFICVTGVQIMLFSAVLEHSFAKSYVPHGERILAGISGYLLLGIFWTICLLEFFPPESLLNQITGEAPTRPETLYYCFVTLTTLGSGDIIPVTNGAKVLAVFNTLSGVLYLAVFVSALVGGVKKTQKP